MAKRYASLSVRRPSSELPERDLIAALVSRDECAALFSRIAATDNPQKLVRSLLGVLVRLATPACTWLEGELAVELFEDDLGTKVRVMSEIGGGMRERVLPVFTVPVTLDALVSAVERRRDVSDVLRLERVSSRCVLLLASEEDEDGAPASFDISETSLAWTRPQSSSDEVDAGWDA